MLCWIINMIILCIFGLEIWRECDIIDENTLVKSIRMKCYIRLAIFALLTGAALYILYSIFGVNESNLIEYIQTRSVSS